MILLFNNVVIRFLTTTVVGLMLFSVGSSARTDSVLTILCSPGCCVMIKFQYNVKLILNQTNHCITVECSLYSGAMAKAVQLLVLSVFLLSFVQIGTAENNDNGEWMNTSIVLASNCE